jgi:pyruvate,orthophosphate dikinase
MNPPIKPKPSLVQSSSALEANLQRTAVDVVIPERHRVLLTITEPLFGVHQETEKLLNEVNHAYVGWKQTLEDLHYRAMGDFYHYNSHERGAEGIEVLCRLYEKAASDGKDELREIAIRYWLYYLEKLASESGDTLPRNSKPLRISLHGLMALFAEHPELAIVASPRLRRCAKALARQRRDEAEVRAVLALSCKLLAQVLDQVYDAWLELADPLDWFRESVARGAGEGEGEHQAEELRAEIPLPDPLPRSLARIEHRNLREARKTLGVLRQAGLPVERNDELLSLPDNGEIVRGYVDAANHVEDGGREPWRNTLARIHWMSRVLGTRLLSAVHDSALHEISRSYADVLSGGDRAQLKDFVHQTFTILRTTEFSNPLPVLDLITTIGTEVMKTRDEAWIDAVIDEILTIDFQYPRFAGFTEEWQVRINPGHLKAIRTYLALVKVAPPLAKRLLAALIVQLKIGGVFIADTDLFQKDISQLLNSDVRWVYDLTKHLCKLFPVYFSDIGAEGELREVSTRLDEARSRKDLLCHFIRKQCHIEANPQLVRFVEESVRYWATGDPAPLAPFLPQPVFDGLDISKPLHAGLHRIFAQLAPAGEVGPLFALTVDELRARLEPFATAEEVAESDIERAEMVIRVRQLVGKKYELDHHDVLERLREFHHIDSHHVRALERAIERDRPREALALVLEILERLQKIILSPEKTEGREDIYHKRHVAVGIPSMYGRYREEKFEAMGLSFRVESLANVLFERMISAQNLRYITKSTLQKVAVWMRMLLRALRVEGFRARGLEIRIWMLEQALQARGITVDQYVNIFQMISNSIKHLIRTRFLDVYESVLERLVGRMREVGVLEGDAEHPESYHLRLGESFLRDLIAQSFGLQRLDNLVGTIIQTLSEERERLDVDTLNLLMTYDVDRCFVQLEQEGTALNGHIYLGNKGFMLKRLAHYGFPVPHGCVLTTEVFRCRRAILAYPELHSEHVKRIHTQIERLEKITGARFGDPRNPLLLSVRSGAAMSMPGMLDSFLNVGMNEEITAGFAAKRDCPWGAWDAYRRFLQFWGMSFGVNRDQFDRLMSETKQRVGVEKKSQLSPEQMREATLRYKTLVRDHRVKILEDPYEQLHMCIDLVLNSWNSEKAKLYRRALHIAEEWGTAVIVQQMVYGNLNARSGTGVVLTRHPWQSADDVDLYGDFVIQGQGDDVVSGIVETYPITEEQRLGETRPAPVSLEKDFPEVYGALATHCLALIRDVGMYHQEIEFTFEGDKAEDLFVLQSRDIVLSETTQVSTFLPTEQLDAAKVASGIGVGGGAICGRVAHTYADVATLRRRYPEDQIVLLRPDTVPDDIHMVLQSDGLLTRIGGATSHAAVASQRLGKACVVGCRGLEVDEERGRSTIAGHAVKTGDFLSINGQDGSVYLGRHPITTVRQ